MLSCCRQMGWKPRVGGLLGLLHTTVTIGTCRNHEGEEISLLHDLLFVLVPPHFLFHPVKKMKNKKCSLIVTFKNSSGFMI